MESLTVPGQLDSLSTIAKYVMSAASDANLNKKSAYKLRLAVDEIATNIILHGYQEAGLEGELYLSSDVSESSLTITIEDTAIAYNPNSYTTPDEEELQKGIQERTIGGLGIFLALDGVDDFKYERVSEGNRNIFVVHTNN